MSLSPFPDSRADHSDLHLLRGEKAWRALTDPGFTSAWTALHRRCSWATAFQGVAFAATWYRTYRTVVEPVLIVRLDAGSMVGLLALAVATQPVVAPKGSVVAAGAGQAEYQSWICTEDLADRFPAEALTELRRTFSSAPLRFRYLPPGTPTRWLAAGPGNGARLQRVRRPILAFGDGSEVSRSLQKPSNRSRLRRLDRLGPVTFRRLGSATELDAVFDEIIGYHDARHLAVHDSAAFHEDQWKRAFHLAMADEPGLLHVSVMTVGDRVASAHLGVLGQQELQLGVIAHNPWLARHSPGKFHIYFLARMLQEEGLLRLDLTAGGDPYKERFANDADEVAVLELPGTPRIGERTRVVARTAMHDTVRAVARQTVAPALARSGVSPALARARLHELRHRGPQALGKSLRHRTLPWNAPAPHLHVLHHSPSRMAPSAGAMAVAVDALQDLITYRATSCTDSRRRFLTLALRRIEHGQRCYTLVIEGRLRCVLWADGPDERSQGTPSEVVPAVHRPPGSVLLHSPYTADGPEDRTNMVQLFLAALADISTGSCVLAAIPTTEPTTLAASSVAGFSTV